jgi:putative ABC transport system permease protein
MAMLKKMKLRLRAIFFKPRMENELQAELQFHIEREVEQNILRGMTPEEAHLAALRSFGGVQRVKEESRDERGVRFMEELWQDVRYGLRMMLKKPGFTLVAIITLAVGIAANTTIFSLADALILRPFNFPNQDRLVMVWERGEHQGGFNRGPVAPGNFSDWRKQNQSFEQLIVIHKRAFDLIGAEQPERIGGYPVSAGFFDALGVKPTLGRAFLPGEDEPGRDHVVVLKHSLWERRFGSDPNIVGKTLTLNAETFTVIGVMPPDFNFPFNGGEMWTPLAFDDKTKQNRRHHYLQAMGLLKPDVSIAQANADLDDISRRAQRIFPETNTGRTTTVVDMTKDIVREAQAYMPPLVGAVAFLLLIACANVANMMLSRSFGRRKEIAVRLALGASRWRLIRQLLTESLLLALAGGFIGLLLSFWAVDLLRSAMPEDFTKFLPGFDHLGVNRVILLFTLMISALSGILFGLLPAWQASKPNLNESLKEGVKGGSSADLHQRLRGGLVVAEIALSLVLLIGAGLMIRSFAAMFRDDMGFDPQSVLSFQLSLFGEKYSEAQRRAFYDQLLERLKATPGVMAVGAASILPMSNDGEENFFEIIGRPPFEKGKGPIADYRVVTPGYFKAIGMSLRHGRGFTDGDNEQAARVVIINETFARRFYSNQEAIGQRIILKGANRPMEIVGVAGDIKDQHLDNIPFPALYVPYAQEIRDVMSIAMRTVGEPTALTAAVRNEVMKLDPMLPVANLKTMERMIHEMTSRKRIMTTMMGVFAVIALLLAGVGLYAVMAYAVSQRTHEIGLRMALGARSSDIIQLVIGQGLKLTISGLGLGMAGAFALTRVVAPLLYGVNATDPLTITIISLSLGGVALLACWIPARRAGKVDPMIAIRCE